MRWLWVMVVIAVTVNGADAARLRFHYIPADAAGHMVFKPGPCLGEKVTVYGTACDNGPPRPNVSMPLRHPGTGQTLLVPLALPAGTPTIYHKSNRVQFNYGSYFVQVNFLPDGAVDVVYSSGFLRDI